MVQDFKYVGKNNTTIKLIKSDTLPDNWRKFAYSGITQELGEDFNDRNENLYIKVPSAVVQGDFNILINKYDNIY
jgi:hypothetical protein